MNAVVLVSALIGHLVGDYLLQNDWMALHKKANYWRCALHAAIWTGAVCLFAGWTNPFVMTFLFSTHFLQDCSAIVARWMDAIGQHAFRTGPCAPWSAIAVDNVWHVVTIYGVWRWLA